MTLGILNNILKSIHCFNFETKHIKGIIKMKKMLALT